VTDELGARLDAMVRDLYPLCRSLTGEGLRETIRRVGEVVPLTIHEVPSGTPILDWEVPLEWAIRAARIEALDGRVLVDFAASNLHVVNYSRPVDAVVGRDELARHVHTLPDQPDLIPYRTGYFADDWGFCLQHRVWETMRDESYRVVVDSELFKGATTYGECFIPGSTDREVLISVHCCHPSLANDNLSGIAIAAHLAARQARAPRRLGYRFLFVPATIGALSWLSANESRTGRIEAGLVLTCIGDPGAFHYKRSRRGDAAIDRAVARVLAERGAPHRLLPFVPMGYDERQYCSPGFDLPVGCFMRSPNGTFPEYHTSADNPDFVSAAAMTESYDVLCDVLDVLDRDLTYVRLDGRGEPQLGRRGLYRAIGGESSDATQPALMWVLNLADGRHSILDMAERSGLPFVQLAAAARIARDHDLIREDVS
jgi:aminopeptidase-like protein